MVLVNIRGTSPVGYPDWIATTFDPGRIEHASRIDWGFRNEVWRVGLAGGRCVAVTRFVDIEAAASIVALTADLEPRLRVVGVPSASVIDGGSASADVLVTEFVDGTVGAALLGEPDGPVLVGSILGATWRHLAGLDTNNLGLDLTWLRPNELVEASRARLGRVGQLLSGRASRRLAEAVAVSGDLLPGRRATFAHGDLLPVNIIVRDGELAALVDFEFARIAEPLLDAGWFDSVVAFHHPAEHGAAWHAFVAASGIDMDDPVTRDLVRILPLLRYLEILDDRSTAPEDVPHWIAMLGRQLGRA